MINFEQLTVVTDNISPNRVSLSFLRKHMVELSKNFLRKFTVYAVVFSINTDVSLNRFYCLQWMVEDLSTSNLQNTRKTHKPFENNVWL